AFRRGFNRRLLSPAISGHISGHISGNVTGNVTGKNGKPITCARHPQSPNIPTFSAALPHAKRKSRQKRQKIGHVLGNTTHHNPATS
ncbi:MAG: hypothetical protein ACXWP0_11985, partial [Ktedonobacterales bacterium]